VISDSEPWGRLWLRGRGGVSRQALADLTLAGIWAGPSSRDRRRLRRQVAYGQAKEQVYAPRQAGAGSTLRRKPMPGGTKARTIEQHNQTVASVAQGSRAP
jgi:hypothetical protein